MTLLKLKSEPYEISIRFYCALREKGLRLEAQARKDPAGRPVAAL